VPLSGAGVDYPYCLKHGAGDNNEQSVKKNYKGNQENHYENIYKYKPGRAKAHRTTAANFDCLGAAKRL